MLRNQDIVTSRVIQYASHWLPDHAGYWQSPVSKWPDPVNIMPYFCGKRGWLSAARTEPRKSDSKSMSHNCLWRFTYAAFTVLSGRHAPKLDLSNHLYSQALNLKSHCWSYSQRHPHNGTLQYSRDKRVFHWYISGFAACEQEQVSEANQAVSLPEDTAEAVENILIDPVMLAKPATSSTDPYLQAPLRVDRAVDWGNRNIMQIISLNVISMTHGRRPGWQNWVHCLSWEVKLLGTFRFEPLVFRVFGILTRPEFPSYL